MNTKENQQASKIYKNNTNAKLCRAQKAKNDEFYTPMETVQIIFEQYLKDYDFSDKIIYCPCDSDKSNFVIYLKENSNSLKYKELIYTSDDFNTHRDLFEKADLIITNPPFSLLIKQFIPLLKEIGKDFFIFGNNCAMQHYYNLNNNMYLYYPDNRTLEDKFITPNENAEIPVCYITNIKLNTKRKQGKLNKNAQISHIYETGTGYRVYDSIREVPYTNEIFLVPLTVLFQHYRYMFDIIDPKPESHKDFQGYSDGKKRFTRIVVRIKPEYLC